MPRVFIVVFLFVLGLSTASQPPSPTSLPTAVQNTAERIEATRREISSRYPEFLSEETAGTAAPPPRNHRDLSALTRIATRTAFFDSFCVHALQNGFTQFVVLGSGKCSRFSRIPNASAITRVWEVDCEEVLNNSRSPPAPHITRLARTLPPVPAASDLIDFDPDKPTVFVMEGLLYYLEEEDVRSVIAACSRLARGRSCCVASQVSRPRCTPQNGKGSISSLFKSGTDTPTSDILQSGWNHATTYTLGEAPADTFREWIKEKYGRQLPPPSQRGKTWYVCAFSDEADFSPFRDKSNSCDDDYCEDMDVVVLGRRLLPGGAISEELKARVAKGVTLAGSGAGNRLVLSGGDGEASAMLNYATSIGFKGVVLCEEQSKNTAENAEKTAPLLRPRVTIVTSTYHEARAKELFVRALKSRGVRTKCIFWPSSQSVWAGEMDWAAKQSNSPS